MPLYDGVFSFLLLLYVAGILAVAVLVIWILVLTLKLLRSVLAERKAREVAAARAGLDRYSPASEELG